MTFTYSFIARNTVLDIFCLTLVGKNSNDRVWFLTLRELRQEAWPVPFGLAAWIWPTLVRKCVFDEAHFFDNWGGSVRTIPWHCTLLYPAGYRKSKQSSACLPFATVMAHELVQSVDSSFPTIVIEDYFRFMMRLEGNVVIIYVKGREQDNLLVFLGHIRNQCHVTCEPKSAR